MTEHLTRAEKIERHFRNTVREKIRDLMMVLDPGQQMTWGSYKYNELLKAARDRIDAEILNEENFAETPTPEKTEVTAAKLDLTPEAPQPAGKGIALELPKQTALS